MSPNPAPPNLPPRTPSAEPVPAANPEWSNQAHDMLALHKIADRIKENQKSHNYLEANKDTLLATHPTTYHVGRGEAMAADMEIQKELDELCSRGDTTTLLDELSFYISSAKGEYSEAQKRAIQADTESMGKSQEESVAFSLMRHQQLRGGNTTPAFDTANTYAVTTYFAAGAASRAHEKATNYVQGMESLADTFERVRTRQADKQEMAALQAEMLITDATDKLDNWPIDSNVADDEADVRDLLRDLNTTLNDFSPVDKLRAKVQGNYVRLRYRLEQRLINVDRLNNSNNTTATMEPDGGIMLDNDTIIYGDGTTARSEQGVRVRRRPIGEIINPQQERLLDATPPTGPLFEERNGRMTHITGEIAFNDWERMHSRETEVRAYSVLNFEIETGNRTDEAQSQMIDALDGRITRAPFNVQDIYDAAQRQGRTNLNPQEQQQVAAINTQEQLDRAEIARLAADRAALRETQNKLKYRKHLIEAGNRPIVPHAPVTRRVMMNAVQISGDLQPAPILNRDGSIDVNATIDNHSSRLWRLLPDGRHVWLGTPPVYRNANGSTAHPF